MKHATTAAIFATAVTAIGWMDANHGWPLMKNLFQEVIEIGVPIRYAEWCVRIGEIAFYVAGIRVIRSVPKRQRYLEVAVLVGIFGIIAWFTREVLHSFLPISAATIIIQQPDIHDLGFWFQVGFLIGVPTVIRGAGLDILRSMARTASGG